MPNYLRLRNFDKMFSRLIDPPIFVNDLANSTEEDREKIRNLFMTRYSGDMISLLPSCLCGATKNAKSDEKCPVCNTSVVSSIENDIQSALWFRQPIGVAPLMNPTAWIWLEDRMTVSGFSVLQYLTDRTYKPDVNKVPFAILKRFEDAKIERGYNNFYENFDKIVDLVFDIKQFKLKGEEDVLPEVIRLYRDSIFAHAIALPNKTLFILEKSNQVTYLDDVTRDAMDMIPLMISIDRDYHQQSTYVKENRTARCISRLARFYKAYYKANLSGKPGQIRRHMYASRVIFSFRCVISSITGLHSHDKIYVPWGVGLAAFRPHLINKLLKHGMELNAAVNLITSHIGRHHPLLERFLDELIAESRDGVVHCILQRNPSLLKGSAMRVGIAGFHKDPGNRTIAMPILLCVAFGADFDGDELNVSIATDNMMADLWYPLRPSFNAFELDVPYKVAANASICKPIISSLSSWLETDD